MTGSRPWSLRPVYSVFHPTVLSPLSSRLTTSGSLTVPQPSAHPGAYLCTGSPSEEEGQEKRDGVTFSLSAYVTSCQQGFELPVSITQGTSPFWANHKPCFLWVCASLCFQMGFGSCFNSTNLREPKHRHEHGGGGGLSVPGKQQREGCLGRKCQPLAS